jgi:hypothetical protein
MRRDAANHADAQPAVYARGSASVGRSVAKWRKTQIKGEKERDGRDAPCTNRWNIANTPRYGSSLTRAARLLSPYIYKRTVVCQDSVWVVAGMCE